MRGRPGPAVFLGVPAGAQLVIRDHLMPRLTALGDRSGRAGVAPVKRHFMAKHVVETALLDAELKQHDVSFAQYLGAVKDRVPAGVSVGIMDSIDELLEHVGRYLEQGLSADQAQDRAGLGHRAGPLVREAFGPDILLQTDANTAYTLADARHLAKLDKYDLLMIEQPLPEDDIRAPRRTGQGGPPRCASTSRSSRPRRRDRHRTWCAAIINIKPARVGGYLEARRIHDVARANGIPVWCGGMLETGIGRAANVALAALPGFTLPGDTSASDRYYTTDLTAPFVLEDGHLSVPTGSWYRRRCAPRHTRRGHGLPRSDSAVTVPVY